MADTRSWRDGVAAGINGSTNSRYVYIQKFSKRDLGASKGNIRPQEQFCTHLQHIKQEIAQIKQGNRTHTEYLSQLRTKFEELKVYLPPTSNPVELQKRGELDEIYMYLSGLDSSYEAARAQILYSSPPDFASVVATIQREESRRRGMNLEIPTENQGFLAHHQYRNPNPNSKEEKRGAHSTAKCDNCKKEGHVQDQCWFLYPHLRPKRKGEKGGGARGKERGRSREGERGERKGLSAVSSGFGSDSSLAQATGSELVGSDPNQAQVGLLNQAQLISCCPKSLLHWDKKVNTQVLCQITV